MSELAELWNQAKKGLEKSSALSPAAAKNAVAPILRAFGKAPALADEVTAMAKAAPNMRSLSNVTNNIDEAAPLMRQAKGRVGKPSVAESGPAIQLSGQAASQPAKTLKDHLGGLKGKWDGLTPGAQGSATGTAIVTGLVGANHMGRSSGKAEGLEAGSQKGYDAGFSNASQQAAQSSMDPGGLGRLMEVFTGRQSAAVNGSDPAMAARRQQALQRILAGG